MLSFQTSPNSAADRLPHSPLVRVHVRPDGGSLDDVLLNPERVHGVLCDVPSDEQQAV